ncbi:RNA polymerase factor sigma-54 [Nevskia ramosa]|uniref:RNA polymerase factor sigma-54 n=1 Tax=Nevskia ramosa TaxID=64002 RepID=UPI0003B472BA|nr:RNA polymerase factor sigma-54 [Nevskia ramosa]
MKPATRMGISQNLAMTPQLLQSIRLLQLSAIELEQEVESALEGNVLLERHDDVAPTTAGAEAPSAELIDRTLASSESTEVAVSGCDEAAGDRVDADFDWSSAESWSGGEPTEDGEPIEARRAAAPIEDARVAALEQLELIIDSRRDWQLAIAIIEHVDDNGYLETELAVILASLPAEWQVTMAELEAALTTVQSVEPTGFAARDLRECLLLQLETVKAGTPGRNLAETLVMNHLERVAARDFGKLRSELGATETRMIQAMDLIRTLDPKPGASRIEPAQAVVPDLIVSGVAGAWKIELNPASLPKLRVNSTYERMMATSASAHRGLKDQMQQARWLVRGLEMRHETLLKTARVVFERQRDFLRRGEEGMLPLTLREVADAIAMHESTVCRVTSNKFVATPWGVYSMKDFFPSQIQGAESDTSGIAVRAMIRRIVDGEKLSAPLCDGAIAAILARGGVLIARRTIAKYREAMKIAPAKERRRIAPLVPVRMGEFARAC